MKCPYCIKVCTKCKRILVAWKGNFVKSKSGKYGLRAICKECRKLYTKENEEKIKKKEKQYYENNKENISKKRKEKYNNDEEYKTNLLEKNKQWRENNEEKRKDYLQQYYEENKEHLLERNKQWKRNNPDRVFNSHHKRRKRIKTQGNGIIGEQWLEMMKYFDWCCAYSGEYLGGNNSDKKRTLDHIIAINNNGLNEIWNLVPCLNNYNISKGIKNMEEWYIQQEFYSEERLQKIYAWCEYAFKKWKPRRKGNRRLKV